MLYTIVHETSVVEDSYLIAKVFDNVNKKELGQIKLELELGQNDPDDRIKIKIIPTDGLTLRLTEPGGE